MMQAWSSKHLTVFQELWKYDTIIFDFCFPESDRSVWLWERIFVVFFFFFKSKTPTYIHRLLPYREHLSLYYIIYLSYNGATLLLKPIGRFMKNEDKYEPDLAVRVAKQAGWYVGESVRSGQDVDLISIRIVRVRSGSTSSIIIFQNIFPVKIYLLGKEIRFLPWHTVTIK